ncbi:hypothetical protein SGRIM128S_04984 [Streptomyces griseomycini]
MTTLTPQKPAHLNPEGDVPAQVSPAPAPTLSPSPESPESPSPDSGWRELVDAVRESGQYPTRSEAESVTRIVLSALGGHVVGDERVDLARALPEEAARVVASQIPATRELTAAEFVDSVAARIEGATPATARCQAFTGYADHVVAVFEQHLGGATTADEAREAVTDLIHTLSENPRRDLILTQELYTLAARHEPYRALCARWMRRSRALLEHHFPPPTARRLDALIEGLTLHRALDDTPSDRALTREAVARITAAP